MRMTVREIHAALKDAGKTLPNAVRDLRAVEGMINQHLDAIAGLEPQLDEAREQLNAAALSGDSAKFEAAAAEVRKLLARRDQLREQYQHIWTRTIEERLQPLIAGTNASIVLEPVLKVLQEKWHELPDELAKEIHERIGTQIAL